MPLPPPSPLLTIHDMTAMVAAFVKAHGGITNSAPILGCSPSYLSEFLKHTRGGKRIVRYFGYAPIVMFQSQEGEDAAHQ